MALKTALSLHRWASSCRALCRCAGAAIWLAGALFFASGPFDPAMAAAMTERIPLPRPRPNTAPARSVQPDLQDRSKAADSDAPAIRRSIDGASAGTQPALPSACRLALTDKIAIAPSLPAIAGPGGCGGEDMVSLEAVVLPDGSRVTVTPPATLRCDMASAIADWVRRDVAILAAGQGARLLGIDNFDSYSCRGRNRVFGAKLSEHGKGNALDIRAFKLANGSNLSLTSVDVTRPLREAMRLSACTRFTTVLGPGSDGYHEDHVHVDLAQRRGGYRLCRWDVKDPPVIAMAAQGAPRRDDPAKDVGDAAQAASGPAGAEGEARGRDGADDPALKPAAPGTATSQTAALARQASSNAGLSGGSRNSGQQTDRQNPGVRQNSASGIVPPPPALAITPDPASAPALPKARPMANAVVTASFIPLPRPRPAQAPQRGARR